jgi:hypothetical protein
VGVWVVVGLLGFDLVLYATVLGSVDAFLCGLVFFILVVAVDPSYFNNNQWAWQKRLF